MSHATVGVIVPKEHSNDQQAYLEAILAPYDEGLEVEPYQKSCYCVSHNAKKHGREMANKLVGTIRERRELFEHYEPARPYREARHAAYGNRDFETADNCDEMVDKFWQEFNADYWQQYEETKRDYTEYHPEYGKTQCDCSQCNGTGVYNTTYNPRSKWDWWVIGGRWHNQLNGDNETAISDMLDRDNADEYTTFALVTPDGEWHERGGLGWFGMVSNEESREDWQKRLLEWYNQYRYCNLVLIDYHI